MLVAVALVPATPVLLDTVTGHGADDLRALRSAVTAALGSLVAHRPRRLWVAARTEVGTLAGFGAPLPPPVLGTAPPPVSWVHELGVRLLGDVGPDVEIDYLSLPEDAAAATALAADVAARVDDGDDGVEDSAAVLVLADGSATRGPRAPKGDDPRGADVDAALALGIREAAPPTVSDGEAAAVGCRGLPGVAFFSGLTAASSAIAAIRAEVTYEGAPTGVGYVVAVSSRRRP